MPFSGPQLDAALRHLLLRSQPKNTASLYSWHSARIFLATMLFAAGVSRAEIQVLCRWQSDESLRIYARLDAAKSASFLGRAMASRATTSRAHNLAEALPFLRASDVFAASRAAHPDFHHPTRAVPDLEATRGDADEGSASDGEPRPVSPGRCACAQCGARTPCFLVVLPPSACGLVSRPPSCCCLATDSSCFPNVLVRARARPRPVLVCPSSPSPLPQAAAPACAYCRCWLHLWGG